jgi:gamma-butyrobetaine dioxygenase
MISRLIQSVEPHGRGVRVAWGDGHQSEFHYTWLRDNCSCADCRHPDTLEATLDPARAPGGDEIQASDLALVDGSLQVTWQGAAHRSLFDPGWLREHCYSEAARAARRRRPTPWREGALPESMPVFAYRDLTASDAILLSWLRESRDVGVTLVRGVPPLLGEVGRVAQLVSFVQRTNFGAIFDVRAKPRPTSNAYTALELPLHTDLPHHQHQPGYQLFHCLKNDAAGGASLLADGFAVAEALRDRDPAAFALLTRLPVGFRYQDKGADHFFAGPVIGLDHEGAVAEIRFAPNVVAPLDVPHAAMESMRRAYLAFAALMNEPPFRRRLRLEPGDMLVTDNLRVLRGREAFDPMAGERHLQGCYVDRSEWSSRIRVLERTSGAAGP